MTVFDHADRLDLHRRESGQSAAQSGAEQWASITRQGQSLQQPGGEITHQEGADDVDRERRPWLPGWVGDGECAQRCSGQRTQRSAGENRSQLAIIVVWHWSIPLGVLMLRFAL